MAVLNSVLKTGWCLGREALSVTTGILAGSIVKNTIHSIAPESNTMDIVSTISGISAGIVTSNEIKRKIRPYSETAGPEYAESINSFFGKKDDDAGFNTEETTDESSAADFSEV